MVLLVLSLLLVSPAVAQSGAETAVDVSTVESPGGPSAFTLFPSAEVIDSQGLHFGMVGVYSHQPLVLERGEERRNAIGARADLDISMAMRIVPRVTGYAVMPLVLVQQGEFGDPLRGLVGAPRVAVIHPRDLRLGASWLGWSRGECAELGCENGDSRIRLLVVAEVSLATGTPELFAGAAGMGASLGLSADYEYRGWLFGAHVGGRYRRAVEVGAARVGSEVRLASGVARKVLSDRLQFGLESEARFRVDEQGPLSERIQHTFEYGAGLRYRLVTPEPYEMLFYIGSGVGGLGAPAMRIVFGLRYGDRLGGFGG